MLPNAKICLYPRNPEEAVRVWSEAGRRALLRAGGTTAALSKDPGVDTLIDLTRMGCDGVTRQGDTWVLGANLRLQALARNPGLRTLWDGMLADAAGAVGSRPIRNAATLGGNLVQCFRWSDPPVALLALNAQVELLSLQGKRMLPIDALFAKHPRQVLGSVELLTAVHLAAPPAGSGGAFTKFARTAFDLAVVDVAACLSLQGGKVGAVRLAIGGTRSFPWRASEAERLLLGSKPSAAAIGAASKAAREAAQTAADVRTGKEYRLRMVEVIVRRTLERAASNAAASVGR